MKAEEEIPKIKRRVKNVEEAIVLLTELTNRHTDRFEESAFSRTEMRSGIANTDEKLNALIDAQIRSEDRQIETDAKTAKSQRLSDAKIAFLAEAQKRSDERLVELAESQKKNDEKFAELQKEQKVILKVLQKLVESFGSNGKN